MKRIIKSLILTFFCFTTAAVAAGEADSGGGGLLVILFLGFLGMVVVFQLLPASMLLVCMVKGVFSRKEKQSTAEAKSDIGS